MTPASPEEDDEGGASVRTPVEIVDADEALGLELAEDKPPLVARLIVEIRSDGTRTIARGGMEDRISGESVTVEASADSPIELAVALAKMIWRTPSIGALALARSQDEGRGPKRGRKRRALARAIKRRLLKSDDE